MRGWFILLGDNCVGLFDDNISNLLALHSGTLNNTGSYLLDILLKYRINEDYKVIYVSDDETWIKLKSLQKANQLELLCQLYHTLKAEESIVDRENRIMELNNKITSNESITK